LLSHPRHRGLRKRLRAVETAYSLARHINEFRMRDFMRELRGALEAMAQETSAAPQIEHVDGSSSESASPAGAGLTPPGIEEFYSVALAEQGIQTECCAANLINGPEELGGKVFSEACRILSEDVRAKACAIEASLGHLDCDFHSESFGAAAMCEFEGHVLENDCFEVPDAEAVQDIKRDLENYCFDFRVRHSMNEEKLGNYEFDFRLCGPLNEEAFEGDGKEKIEKVVLDGVMRNPLIEEKTERESKEKIGKVVMDGVMRNPLIEEKKSEKAVLGDLVPITLNEEKSESESKEKIGKAVLDPCVLLLVSAEAVLTAFRALLLFRNAFAEAAILVGSGFDPEAFPGMRFTGSSECVDFFSVDPISDELEALVAPFLVGELLDGREQSSTRRKKGKKKKVRLESF